MITPHSCDRGHEHRQSDRDKPEDPFARLAHGGRRDRGGKGDPCTLSLVLENPWPCGLPPGPPTR